MWSINAGGQSRIDKTQGGFIRASRRYLREQNLFHLVDIQSNVYCLTLVFGFGYFGLILSDREKEERNSLVIACGETEIFW